MKVIKTKINAQDKRGIIKDILTHVNIDAITYLTSKEGAVRGNHYHKKTVQYEYVLSGSFLCCARKGEKGKIRQRILKAGALVCHPPYEVHALRALENAELLSFTKGPRRGYDYEKDTYRLKEKLISENIIR